MATFRQSLAAGFAMGLLPLATGGCYLYSGESFENWPEVRLEREGGGEMVGRVKRSAPENLPGDSYKVLIRWPTGIPTLTRALAPEQREKEAEAFVRKLCGENRDIYVVLKSFNDRNGEAYYDLWCKPPKTA